LVHVPPSGTWGYRKSGDLIAADAWIRSAREPGLDAAVATTVQRHLAAVGPATPDDIAPWSSIRTPAIRAALASLGPKVRTFTDPPARTLYDVRGAPFPHADSLAVLRLLPERDGTLLAYAPPERVGILSAVHRMT